MYKIINERYVLLRSPAHAIILLLLTSLFAPIIHAEPWFTGPVLITPAVVMPLGSANWEVYLQNSNTNGYYDYDESYISTPLVVTNSFLSKFTYGLASGFDFEVDTIYIKNQTEGQSGQNIGDTLMLLGFQALTQGTSHSRPNLKITLQELFPTGRYDFLSPNLYATDATGGGSYQTSLGFNFSFLSEFNNDHYLQTSASVTITKPQPTHLREESIYGGSSLTDGTLYPGNAIAFDLAAEYSLTQHWVTVLEGYFLAQKASVFTGDIGPTSTAFGKINKRNPLLALARRHIRPSPKNIGNKDLIGNGNLAELDILPGLEYNFSKNIGVIGSVWLTTSGKNTPEFVCGLLVLNMIF